MHAQRLLSSALIGQKKTSKVQYINEDISKIRDRYCSVNAYRCLPYFLQDQILEQLLTAASLSHVHKSIWNIFQPFPLHAARHISPGTKDPTTTLLIIMRCEIKGKEDCVRRYARRLHAVDETSEESVTTMMMMTWKSLFFFDRP